MQRWHNKGWKLYGSNRSRRHRWQEYTEEPYKKDLHDPDNNDAVIIHLELDTLECEVKWALGSITANKPGGGDSISVELFQILKDDAVKFYAQYASKFGKLSSGIMLKILQAGLQQYLSCELPDVQAGFRKGRGTRDQIANIH